MVLRVPLPSAPDQFPPPYPPVLLVRGTNYALPKFFFLILALGVLGASLQRGVWNVSGLFLGICLVVVLVHVRRSPEVYMYRGYLEIAGPYRRRQIHFGRIRLIEPAGRGYRLHLADGDSVRIGEPRGLPWRRFMREVAGNPFG